MRDDSRPEPLQNAADDDDGDIGHISSAIISVHPRDAAAVADKIVAIPGNEVHAVAGSRIIVVMEDCDARALGNRLDMIAGLPGVLSAALVFEQSLDREPKRDIP
jgi:periplasmic nitrate reductase NapD